MTKPRKSAERELFGILGTIPDVSKVLASWNAHFLEEGSDAHMARYATTSANLPERLSEMFHFDRRAYIIGERLQEDVLRLLDQLEESAVREKKANTILNEGGILIGAYLNDAERRERFTSKPLKHTA